METSERLHPGVKVHYLKGEKWDNGIVKEITNHGVRVVYHCNGDWENYQNYTSQLTELEHLALGWRFDGHDSSKYTNI